MQLIILQYTNSVKSKVTNTSITKSFPEESICEKITETETNREVSTLYLMPRPLLFMDVHDAMHV